MFKRGSGNLFPFPHLFLGIVYQVIWYHTRMKVDSKTIFNFKMSGKYIN